MEKKQIIVVAILAAGIATWRMGAMQEKASGEVKLETSDGQIVRMSKVDAQLFGMIRDAIGDVGTEAPIPLKNVKKEALERLIVDLPWARTVRINRKENETEAQYAVEALEKSGYSYSAERLRNALENLRTAHFLQSPELIERYASIIARMLVSDQSSELLYNNDSAHIALIQEIELLRGEGDEKTYADKRNAGPFHIFAKLIYKYIPQIWRPQLALKKSMINESTVAACRSASFSSDGSRVIGSCNKVAGIWDAYTGEILHELQGHEGDICSASLSPDGTQAITGAEDGTVRIWDAIKGGQKRILLRASDNKSCFRAIFSGDGKRIAAAGGICVLLNEKTIERQLNAGVYIRSVCFLPDGRIATGAANGTVSIWNADTGALIHTFKEFTGMVHSISISSDGQRMMAAPAQDGICIWNVANGVLERKFAKSYTTIKTASMSLDGNKVVITGIYGSPSIWNTNTGIKECDLGFNNPKESASFSPDGKRIVLGSYDVAGIWMLMPMESFDQALFMHMLYNSRSRSYNEKGPAGWQTGWGRMVMDTYKPKEKELIKRAFPKEQKTLMQKAGEFFG